MQGGPDATFAAWDKDGNGTLSQDEFRAGWMATREDLAVRRLRNEFARHDADKSGKLEAGEYAKLALVQRAGASAPAMTTFDANKDGGLQFAEYLDFVKVAGAQQQAARGHRAEGEVTMAYSIVPVWRNITPELQAELADFWIGHKAMADVERAKLRAQQAVCVLRDADGALCGVATAFVQVRPRLRQPMYYFRQFIAPAHRQQQQAIPIFKAACEILEAANRAAARVPGRADGNRKPGPGADLLARGRRPHRRGVPGLFAARPPAAGGVFPGRQALPACAACAAASPPRAA